MQNLYKCKSYARTPVQKLEYPRPHPGYYTMAGLRVSRENLRGVMHRFAAIYEDFCVFTKNSREARGFSRPAPASSLALNNSAKLKISIDRIDYALYNIVMKLRNRYEYYRSEWQRHWRVVVWHPLTAMLIMIAIAYIFEL